ncbi:MAG: methyltransferase domain-containing protein [Alteraurantiacibacter sp.]
MTDISEWQGRTGKAWAEEWRRTDRSFGQLTERLLADTRKFAFRRVIDVGCGAGELSLAIARGRSDATVNGIDVSDALIDVAQKRSASLANVAFECADAARWTSDRASAPDFVVSRHGVMFFAQPADAFAHLAKQCAADSGMLFSCFRKRSENPFFSEVMRLLPEPPDTADATAPGPFAFADPDHLCSILANAGWTDIVLVPFDFPMIAGAGEDAVSDALAYWQRIGPVARAASELDVLARERLFDRIRRLAERHDHDGIVALPAAAWIVTARRA